jgi:apolipoprotein D and lipocalin family protein
MGRIAGLRIVGAFAAGLGMVGSLAGCVSGPVGNPTVPAPTKMVALDRYLGRYYEMARYEQGFERGCEGVTAEYAALPNGLVSVVNTCHKGAPDGPVNAVHGRAKAVGDAQGAKFKVSFFGPFFVGDYWVLDHGDNYEWSIVGEGSGRYLWLLTRDPAPSEAERSLILARTKALGYDTNLLRFTKQPPG